MRAKHLLLVTLITKHADDMRDDNDKYIKISKFRSCDIRFEESYCKNREKIIIAREYIATIYDVMFLSLLPFRPPREFYRDNKKKHSSRARYLSK